MAKTLLRLRMGGLKAGLAPAAVFLAIVCGCAQTPQPLPQPQPQSQPPTQPQAQFPSQAPAQPQSQAKKPDEQSKKSKTPASTAPQTFEESTRFLKSIPPKPEKQLPYPSIATPPIEQNPDIPLLTEAQQKKMEEDLSKLNARHQKGMPKIAPETDKDKKERRERKKKKPDEKTEPKAQTN